jgi:hypothetical protein
MKKLFLFTLSVLSVYAGNAQTTYPSGVTGCLARWSFDNNGTITGTVPDVSGNNHNGTPTTLISAPDFRNIGNKAAYFNGAGSHIVVPHNASLNPQNISIVSLIKPHAFYAGLCQVNTIIYKGFTYYIPGSWALSLTEQDNNCSQNTPSSIALQFDGPNPPPLPPLPSVNLNQWYFMVATYEGSTVKRYQVPMDPNNYVSGITPMSTMSYNPPLGSNSYDVWIGGTPEPTFPYWFNGDMDELVIFNKALTDNEVQSIYDYLWGSVMINEPFSDSTLCGQDTFDVDYTVLNNGVFGTGNVFTMQLSDATGSFTNPVAIGSVTATTSGTINCILPAGLPYSSNYRVRIASSVPVLTSSEAAPTITIGHPTTAAQVTVTPGTNVTFGTFTTFTAAVTNMGTSVQYYWRKNGVDIGVNPAFSVYTATAGADFVNADAISAMVVVTDTICDYEDTVYTNNIVMQMPVSVNEFNEHVSMQLHPSPNKGSFAIKVTDVADKAVDVQITNVTGQRVYNGNIKTGIEQTINIPEAVPGIYFLNIHSDHVDKTIKFTVL